MPSAGLAVNRGLGAGVGAGPCKNTHPIPPETVRTLVGGCIGAYLRVLAGMDCEVVGIGAVKMVL